MFRSRHVANFPEGLRSRLRLGYLMVVRGLVSGMCDEDPDDSGLKVSMDIRFLTLHDEFCCRREHSRRCSLTTGYIHRIV